MNLVALDFWLVASEVSHRQLDKLGDIFVDMTTQAEHDDFCEFAAADSVDPADLFVSKDDSDHVNQSF